MSTKKRPGEQELRGMLLEGHFGQPREFRSADPISPTHMHLEIERIKPYERNPRRQRNPMYAQIRASILAKRGLDDPLGITRRPGDALYTVRAGGNTRLSILKELWRETEDPAFSRAYCLFVPWTSESDSITAHLIENELRGELVFIDKAVALQDLLEQLEEESGSRLSRNEYLRRLAEIGYPVSKRQMIRYEYAAEVLDRLLPEALEAGLGGRQLAEIRDAEQRYREYWARCGLAPDAFDDLFRTTLAENDSDGWDLRTALDDLEMRISERAGKPINTVRLEVDAPVGGTPSSPVAATEPPANRPVVDLARAVDAGEAKNDPGAVETDFDGTGTISTSSRTDPSSFRDKPPAPSEHVLPAVENDAAEENAFPKSDSEASAFLSKDLNAARQRLPAGFNLKSLRSRATVLATRFAQSFDCQRLIRPTPHGYGFFVDIPDERIQVRGNVTRWGWWLLFSLSEQAITQARLKLAPGGSLRLPALLAEESRRGVLAVTGQPPDAIHTLGHAFLTSPELSDRAFQDLLALIETCRILRNSFPEEKLWPCPTIAQLKGERR